MSRDKHEPMARTDWTVQEVEQLARTPHDERLKAKLDARDQDRRNRYPDGMTRPDGSRQGDE